MAAAVNRIGYRLLARREVQFLSREVGDDCRLYSCQVPTPRLARGQLLPSRRSATLVIA